MTQIALPKGLSVVRHNGKRGVFRALYRKHGHRDSLVIEGSEDHARKVAKSHWDHFLENGQIVGKSPKFIQAAMSYKRTQKETQHGNDTRGRVDRLCEMLVRFNGREMPLGGVPLTAINSTFCFHAIERMGGLKKIASGRNVAHVGDPIGWKLGRAFGNAFRGVLLTAERDEMIRRTPWETKVHKVRLEQTFMEPKVRPGEAKAQLYRKSEVRKLTTVQPGLDQRITAEIIVAFRTGLRTGEIRKLKLRDLNFEPPEFESSWDDETDLSEDGLGYLWTAGIKTTNGQEVDRLIPLVPELVWVLKWWIEVGFPERYGREIRPSDFLFPQIGDAEKEAGDSLLPKHFDQAHRAAGVERVARRVTHGVRHVVMTLAKSRGQVEIVRAATHGNAKRGNIADTYSSDDWVSLCSAWKICTFGGDPVEWGAPAGRSGVVIPLRRGELGG